MKTRVFDSWPILEWINGREPTAGAVTRLIEEASAGRVRILMSAINVGEVYYFLRKTQGERPAENWRLVSQTLPLVIEAPTLEEIWAAALLKSRYPISYADSFAAALARKHRCTLLTGDPDFHTVDGLELEWMARL